MEILMNKNRIYKGKRFSNPRKFSLEKFQTKNSQAYINHLKSILKIKIRKQLKKLSYLKLYQFSC
jgi:hypothetical protein